MLFYDLTQLIFRGKNVLDIESVVVPIQLYFRNAQVVSELCPLFRHPFLLSPRCMQPDDPHHWEKDLRLTWKSRQCAETSYPPSEATDLLLVVRKKEEFGIIAPSPGEERGGGGYFLVSTL